MSLLDKVATKEEVKLSSESLIKNAFLQSAPTYWGEISKLKIYHHRTTGQGTEYYLILCETDKDGKQGKLLQEWYISKKNEPMPNPKRQFWLDISLADEIAGALYE